MRYIKFIALLLTLLLTLSCFAGCDVPNNNENNQEKTEQEAYINSIQFQKIKTQKLTNDVYIYIYYDVNTKVMYQFIDGYQAGGLSVMYNSDGSVMLYEGNE